MGVTFDQGETGSQEEPEEKLLALLLSDGMFQTGYSVSIWSPQCVPNCFSRVQLFVTLWIVAHQAPLSMGFSRREYCSGLPCPPPGDLPNPGTEPRSPALQTDSLPSESPGKSYVLLSKELVQAMPVTPRVAVWFGPEGLL